MEYPKVSFISTSFNSKNLLEKTMLSVLEQDYPNIEHVIIDGGSTDGTVELIKQYEPIYNGKLIWISEPDKGIYDAVNKAHRLLTGDFVMGGADPFINKSVISKMINTIQSGNFDGCFGGIITLVDDKVVRKWSGKAGSIKLGWIPATPTLCISKKVFEDCGEYKTDYIAAADYEYSIRIFLKNKYRFIAIEEPLVLFEGGGTSNGSIKANWLGIREGHKALKENNVKFAIMTDILRIIRSFWQYRFSITKKEYTL